MLQRMLKPHEIIKRLSLPCFFVIFCVHTNHAAPQQSSRGTYIAEQVLVSGLNFGLALPYSNGLEGFKPWLATQLIVWPLSFGGHLLYARNRSFNSEHLATINQMVPSSLAATYTLPLAFDSPLEPGLRMGSWASIASYPLSIWAAYSLGDKYSQVPGGIAGQSWGISAHSILGAAAGAELAALQNRKELLSNISLVVLGASLGHLEAVYFFHRGKQSSEQGMLNFLGLSLGSLVGTGVVLLVDDGFTNRTFATSVISGSALVGYVLTSLITRGMTPSSSTGGPKQPRFELTFPSWAISPGPDKNWELKGLGFKIHL